MHVNLKFEMAFFLFYFVSFSVSTCVCAFVDIVISLFIVVGKLNGVWKRGKKSWGKLIIESSCNGPFSSMEKKETIPCNFITRRLQDVNRENECPQKPCFTCSKETRWLSNDTFQFVTSYCSVALIMNSWFKDELQIKPTLALRQN